MAKLSLVSVKASKKKMSVKPHGFVSFIGVFFAFFFFFFVKAECWLSKTGFVLLNFSVVKFWLLFLILKDLLSLYNGRAQYKIHYSLSYANSHSSQCETILVNVFACCLNTAAVFSF